VGVAARGQLISHRPPEHLGAIDGTPVLDIKPYAAEFNPRGPIREPGWMGELMREYF
jgi:tRNA (adenine37-N6)-methyltransferase